MELAAVKRLDDALPHDEVQKTSIRSVLSREMCTRTSQGAHATVAPYSPHFLRRPCAGVRAYLSRSC